jgi:hypothetical protein
MGCGGTKPAAMEPVCTCVESERESERKRERASERERALSHPHFSASEAYRHQLMVLLFSFVFLHVACHEKNSERINSYMYALRKQIVRVDEPLADKMQFQQPTVLDLLSDERKAMILLLAINFPLQLLVFHTNSLSHRPQTHEAVLLRWATKVSSHRYTKQSTCKCKQIKRTTLTTHTYIHKALPRNILPKVYHTSHHNMRGKQGQKRQIMTDEKHLSGVRLV